MSSLRNTADRDQIKVRIQALIPESSACWGRMNVHQAICHMADQMRVAIGEIESQTRFPLILRPLLRLLVVHTPLPVPKGKVQTVPEMLTSKPHSWDRDIQALLLLVDQLAEAKTTSPHPAFGNLTLREWSILAYKHLDHHLEQFGV